MKGIIRIFVILALIGGGSLLHAQDSAKTEQKGKMPAATPLPELDRFHELLHPLVHDAYPNNDFAAIKKALPKLISAATRVSKMSLPKEYASSKGEFRKASKKLVQELRTMNSRKGRLADKEFGELFSQMHETFEGMLSMVR